MRRFALAFAILFATTAPAWAETQPLPEGLPEGVTAILDRAVAKDAEAGTSTYLRIALKLAAEAYPDRKEEIFAYVGGAAPDRAANLDSLISDPPESITADAAPKPKPAPPLPPRGFISLTGWSGSVELGASLNTGNTEEKSIAAAFKVLNIRKDWRHKLGGEFYWTRTDGETSRNRLVFNYQLDYLLTDRLYLFVLGKYEDDRFSGFNWRVTESLGLGYSVLRGQTYGLDIEGSLAARHSKISPAGPTQNEPGGRINTVLYWHITEKLRLDNEASALITTQRTTLENTIGLKTKITDSISGKLSFNIKHETNVPLGARKTDTVTRATVLYNF